MKCFFFYCRNVICSVQAGIVANVPNFFLQNVKYDGYWKHSSSNVAHIKSTLQFKILLGGYDAKCIKNLITSSNTNIIIIIVILLLFLVVVRRWGWVLFTTRWHCTAFSVLTAGGGKTRDAFDWDDQSHWIGESNTTSILSCQKHAN